MPLYAIDDIRPELPDNDAFWIAPDASLIGRVRLHHNASIWFGAVLRGDNDWITIGENSNVQDLSVIHTDFGQPTMIGKGVTVGHRVILHSCHIGDDSLIGMGSTILNRARIGRNTIVGANTLVPEGKEFPDGVLILGAPGRVARVLGEAELTMLKASSEVYVQNYQRFRRGLSRVD